jgi:membrane protease YdiL (CAAX protease family)
MTDPLSAPSSASGSSSPLVDEGRQLVLIAVVIVAVGVATYFGFNSPSGSAQLWLTLCLPTIALAAIGAFRAQKDGELAAWLRPTWGDFTRGFAVTLVLFAGAYVFVKVLAPAGTPREGWMARIYLQLGDPSVMRKHAPLVAFALIAMSAAEEIVWRGLVTTLFAERFGSRRAWIFAAVAYGAAHVPAMWALRDEAIGLNPILPLAALGAGLVWGALTRFYGGRVFPAIVSHALFYWCVLMMFRLWGPSV